MENPWKSHETFMKIPAWIIFQAQRPQRTGADYAPPGLGNSQAPILS
jgi:hypothetical protein